MDFKKLIVEGGLARVRDLRGCSSREIRRVEKLASGKLPTVYKEFLVVAGRGAGDFWSGSDAFFPEILHLREYAQDLLVEEGKPDALPPESFVFMSHQGYQFYYFHVSNDQDPPVYYYMEGLGEPVVRSPSLSEFFLDEIQKEAGLAARLRQRQGKKPGSHCP